MAKVTITLEDQPNGTVKAVCDPSYESMAKAITGGHSTSNAFGLALKIANTMLAAAREASQGRRGSGIILPALKPGRLH